MTGRGIQLGRAFGIPIRMDYSWTVIVFLLTVTLAVTFGQSFPYLGLSSRLALGLSASLLLFGSVLAHELSHALVAIRHRVGIRGITLFIFGGAAEMVDEPPNAAAELRIAIAGPIMSLFLGLGFGGLYLVGVGVVPPPFVELVRLLSRMNFVLVAFNMVPGFPLDGGRVLRAALWGVWGKLSPATWVAAAVGSFFGLMVIVFGLLWIFVFGNLVGGLWFILIGFFLRNAARTSYQQLVLRRALEGVFARDLVTPGVATARPEMTLADVVDEVALPAGVSEVPVVQHGQLVGMLRLVDIRSRDRDEWGRVRAGDVMSRDAAVHAIPGDESAIRVLARLGPEEGPVPVVENGLFVGVVTRSEMLRRIQPRLEAS